MAYVNSPVNSDARLPSGGIKNSGFGRECSEYGKFFNKIINVL